MTSNLPLRLLVVSTGVGSHSTYFLICLPELGRRVDLSVERGLRLTKGTKDEGMTRPGSGKGLGLLLEVKPGFVTGETDCG